MSFLELVVGLFLGAEAVVGNKGGEFRPEISVWNGMWGIALAWRRLAGSYS